MKTCLREAKKIIDKQVKDDMPSFGIRFTEYAKCYGWTNENINAYLQLADFTNKNNALSVLASGDQAFNLITNGVNTIDTFDVNKLTEYYALGLKRAMILRYSYEEFNIMMAFLVRENANLDILSDTIRELLPYMDTKHAAFWSQLIDYNYKVQRKAGTNVNLIRMLCVNYSFRYRNIINNYLVNEENYEKLRKRLGQANISFKCVNAVNLDESFQGRYDFILLSNIMDYFCASYGKNWSYDKLLEYEKRLEGMVNPNGIIFLDYVFDYPFFEDDPVIDGSCITAGDLKNDEKIVILPHTQYNFGEAIILKRVK